MKTKSAFRTVDMAYIAVFAVIMALCSWISIPTTVPFTLQTFGVFCALGVLGGRRGFFSILTFILLGAVGVPVFAGFSGGIGVLFGSTGGYIIGFLFTALIYWGITAKLGNGLAVTVVSYLLGLIACYAFGTAWFMMIYSQANGSIGVATALGWCVIPFIVPDLAKIALAIVVSNRVKVYAKL